MGRKRYFYTAFEIELGRMAVEYSTLKTNGRMEESRAKDRKYVHRAQ